MREDELRRTAARIDLLLVTVDPGEGWRLRGMLESSDAPHFQVSEASGVDEALRMLHECAFDAVLLDLTIPEGGDLDMLMRARVAAADTPVVVLAADDREDGVIEALRAGAQDYLTREECSQRRLSRAIHQAVERHGIRAELQAARNREHFIATHDGLTGLPNRESFLHKIPSALAQARRNGRGAGLLFIDLDHFKAINDSLGHAAGDQLLKFVAERLSMGIRATDTLARLAGDEFVLFLPDVPDPKGMATVAQNLLRILNEPYLLAGHESWITASIGVAVFPVDGETAEELLRNSDMAMYRAKLSGRNNFQFCTESMNAAAARRILIRDRLQEAFEQGGLSVTYQPIRDTRTGRVTAAETLLRWTDPEAECVHPDEFIPVAEDTGLIVPIGEWVLRTACAQNRAWQDQGYRPIRISVNISPRQLRQHTLAAAIAEILRESDLSPESLELEITESSLVQSDKYTVMTLNELGQMGIGLSIDDFGTGYCALSYLRKFQFNRVKVDRSFVEGVAESSDASALTSAIILLARSLKLASVVEGIETEEQAALLTAQGCDEIQGFLFGAPVSADEFTKFLDRTKDD
jgi:diguanylate cyclase (GGDEF)-like protein